MKKLRKNLFREKERLKVFIWLDRHLQRLKLTGFIKDIPNEFPSFPENGFDTLEDFEKWQAENLWINKENSERWQRLLYKAPKCAKLPESYLHTVENFIALNIQVADVNLPGIPPHRIDENYLRAKKLIELYDSINPKTGKRYTAKEVAEMYDPDSDSVHLPERIWKDKLGVYGQKGKKYYRPIIFTQGEYNSWLGKYGVFTSSQVRKMVSKHRKRLLE